MGKYFYAFNNFLLQKVFKNSKIAQIYYYEPQPAGINVQSPQSESTPRRLTLVGGEIDPLRPTFYPDEAYAVCTASSIVASEQFGYGILSRGGGGGTVCVQVLLNFDINIF